MVFSIKNIISVLLFLVAFNCFSQKNEQINYNIVPNSIYTNIFTVTTATTNNTNLKFYKFYNTKNQICENTNFQEVFQNLKEIYKSGVFETHQKNYNNNSLKKSFFKVANLYLPHNK